MNLLRALRARTQLPVGGEQEAVVEPGAAALFQYPFVFACGHGNMKFTPTEVANLRRYLISGGFLWVDDDFGIEPSFRREMKRLFPELFRQCGVQMIEQYSQALLSTLRALTPQVSSHITCRFSAAT